MLALLGGLASAGTVRHAVVVGANDGGGTLEALKYAEADAERMGSLLVELGEFDEALVDVLYRPTADELREALARHAAVASDYDDLFLFYYSGHADAGGLRLGDDRYFYESLKHDLRAVPAEVRIGILDACRSGSIVRLKGADVSESILGDEGSAVEGEAWLTASAADELAQESDALRGGFFTHYLLSGMRGAADTNDGIVDLDELNRYTFDRVVDVTGRTGAGTQHPRFEYQLAGGGTLGLTNVRRASAMLVLQESDAGQVAVFRLPDRTQLAEFVKAPAHEMSIAVPPGGYLVRRRHDDAVYEATFNLSDGGRMRIEEWGRPTLEEGVVRGGDPAVASLVEASEAYEAAGRFGSSPALAGGASLVLPGAGQLYNRQWWKGLAYFAVTSSVAYGIVYEPERERLGTTFWPMLGAAVWGASIADATYNVHRREQRHPDLGARLSVSGVSGGGDWPAHVGVSADLLLRRGVSIGLDRVGYTPGAGGSWDLHAGSRVVLDWGDRFQPNGVLAAGVRHGLTAGPQGVEVTRLVFSGGGGLRYYVVPRYFVEAEGRYENAGDWQGWTSAIGMGVHVGR